MYNTDNKYNYFLNKSQEIGIVKELLYPIVLIEGLPGVSISELVYFENDTIGFVTSLSEKYVEVLLFDSKSVTVGSKVVRTGEPLSIPVGEMFLGKTIDSLGRPLSSETLILDASEKRLVDIPSSGISSRVKITEPFETGVTTVDLMVPLGKGQRELVIGDRKIGKSAFLLQTMLRQAKSGTIVIYASIGKTRVSVKQLEEFVAEFGISDKVILIASSASESLGTLYLTPYSAMTMAEYFRDKGQDTLVILDDLSSHAKYYREVSLIAKKFPGREAYPGDIFYSHARLLERAGLFNTPNKATAITCLPVAETVEGDISGYIQTNLMSITDGHLFFDSDLFKQGRKPALNHFLSVTRVGRQTQSKLRWGVNRELTSFFTLLNKTQNFVHFGAELNEGIKSTLDMGNRLISFFNQPIKEIIPIKVQIFFYCLIWIGLFNKEENDKINSIYVKVSNLYGSNSEFTNLIDSLVNEKEEFNVLLGKVSSQSAALYAQVMKLYESK